MRATARQPKGPTSASAGGTKKAAKTKRPRTAKTVAKFPLWFPTSPRAQKIAEWLAFDAILDRALGVVPSPERWPYSEYKRVAVDAFLKRLEGVDLDRAMA